MKIIERVTRILEKKSLTTHEETQSLVAFFFAAKVVYLGQGFV